MTLGEVAKSEASTNWAKELEAFLLRLKDQKRLQPSTLELYRRDLTQLLDFFSKTESSRELSAYLTGLAASTASRKLIVWRNFLRSFPNSLLTELEKIPFPKLRHKVPRFLREEEVFALENASFRSRFPTRDRLLLSLGVELGLRLQEMLQLRFQDIHGEWLRVVRKGGHEQQLPLTTTLQTLLRFWKEERRAELSEFVFAGPKGTPITPRAVQKLFRRLQKSSGMKEKLHPHALRHTFATRLAANGASLVALKEILGHRQLATTERYLHVTPQYLKDALQFLRPKHT